MRELLRAMPPELREAHHLMQLSRENNDPAAQQRASALALKAVQNGSPQVRQEFIKSVGEQMPELADQLAEDIGNLDTADPSKMMEKLQTDAVHKAAAKKLAQDSPDDPTNVDIAGLRDEMIAGQAATRKELDKLQKKQEEIEQIRSPEEFMKFLTEGGITQEDIQRILSGDEEHMQKRFSDTIDKQMDTAKKAIPEDALQKVDQLHSTLFGTTPETTEIASPPPETKKPVQNKPPPPKEPEVIVPMYRLQYEKDESGRYQAVQLKCNLPGVADMSMINLDVSEKHVRLTTAPPAPRYAVNAGPFPVLIDAGSARAKYSKKREELSISVLAKTD
jgi:hypothetical protein